ncbi:MAG: hypothetical protein RLY58_2159, partial [Pseudomonadota bacterium]
GFGESGALALMIEAFQSIDTDSEVVIVKYKQ